MGKQTNRKLAKTKTNITRTSNNQTQIDDDEYQYLLEQLLLFFLN